MLQPFPIADLELVNDEAVGDVNWLKAVVTGVRNIRGEMDISPAKEVPILFSNGNAGDQKRLKKFTRELTFLVRPESLNWINMDAEKPMSATALVGSMEIMVPMAGLIDKDAELSRLDKDIGRKEKDLEKALIKINNPKFVEKAPIEIVEKERDKIEEINSALKKLKGQRSKIEEI